MNSIFISIVYILFVVALHQYLKNNFPYDAVENLPSPLKYYPKNQRMELNESDFDISSNGSNKDITRTNQEHFTEKKSDYKSDLLNVFSDMFSDDNQPPLEKVAEMGYTDPLKPVNPDYSELDKYYSDLNKETYSFEPVPMLKDNTEKKFKTHLLNDVRADLNHEIVYDNIMAFEDFEASYAPL